EWTLTAEAILTEALDHTLPADFAAPFSAPAQERFEAFYRRAVLMLEVFRVKIYDTTMTVVWSDEAHLIGQHFLDNPHLMGALAGRVTANLETHARKGEHIYEGKEFPALV